MEKALYTKNLAVGYAGKPVLEDVNISLNKGEIMALIGPNGAGKSTLLRTLARQLNILNGNVYLDDKDINEYKRDDLARKVAVVFTDRVKGELMTCKDVVESGRYPYTGFMGKLSDNDKQIVARVMEDVRIHDIGDKDYNAISDGQRQRVMLARALCQEPEIIILDEPTSYLDVKYKLEFLMILEEMKKKSDLTVIMSVHELDLARRFADKVVCIKDGKVDREGSSSEVIEEDYINELFGISSELTDYARDKQISVL
ncbi:MAG: ABC transporter ATP-binding protein [Lachnospiraceae bacterium]|nr:ABC transporter ATP-binding protein [Lachnospiraceae bacterium]